MWAATEILPVLVRFTGDVPAQGFGTGGDRTLGVVDLVLAPLGLELAHPFGNGTFNPSEGTILGNDPGHLLFDRAEVLLSQRAIVRHGQVIIKAVLNRRAVHELDPGDDALHRFGHDMRATVAQESQGFRAGFTRFAIHRRDERDRRVSLDGRA